MKQVLIFCVGLVAGALILYALGFRKESTVREKIAQELIEGLSNNFADREATVEYIEIKGKKGNMTLYTGMTKDSVQRLVGKADEVNYYKLGNTNYEKWGYKMKNSYVSDLDISFRDGRLEGVRQY